ncbi:type 2 lactosamine alpha-2,3-sialyltransferase-like isoform X2 [Acipenser ruthenus]|uniref:type 2 lactosamine alpha-2,3-sialyltransferase-like isoform X2 n=1 Tax=Acipenser ruthenus TaxID=7906 RepID=UPI00274087DA|nr:type 2 lactosamine alpha-2,3-sialyltransferase-like isoform X2 [Acipenser ruthenus]XP_058885182.1 type 2 lactosamine alpha-2,3-sialyltransferase-like isoform X2 [Acipenser ruthenus]
MRSSTKMCSTMKKGSIKFWVAVMAALSLSCSTFILTKMSFASHRLWRDIGPFNAVQDSSSLCQPHVIPEHFRIEKKSNPFLCFSDVNGSTKDTTLANHQLPYGIQKLESMFATVLRILKGCDLPLEVKKNKCRKCVVVGNGAVLRNKTLGKIIDSFEVVIRINSGPVRGYESDVGKRTTFRLCYPESIFKDSRDADPNTTVVIIPFKPHDLRWMTEVLQKKTVNVNGFWTKPATKLIYKPDQLRVLNPFYLDKAAHNFLHLPEKLLPGKIPTHPTSGIIAITMALNVCENVYIAGFKYNLSSNNYLHYYGKELMFEMRKNNYHNITAEQIFLHQLKYSQAIIDLTEE